MGKEYSEIYLIPTSILLKVASLFKDLNWKIKKYLQF
jgi:hypothetical protein